MKIFVRNGLAIMRFRSDKNLMDAPPKTKPKRQYRLS
jgi:hypothetical protein